MGKLSIDHRTRGKTTRKKNHTFDTIQHNHYNDNTMITNAKQQ